MKTLVLLSLLLLPFSAFAQPGTQARVAGIKNFRTVMPGVLYRGGGEGDKEPLSDGALRALCEDGITSAVYVYRTGWRGNQAVACGQGRIDYSYQQWDRESALRPVLSELRDIIRRGSGAMYVHCWYGVHASGYVVTTALMQFCGYSGEEAVAYWNSNVPPSIQYPKVQQMIRNFRPFADLTISAEDRARVCPR